MQAEQQTGPRVLIIFYSFSGQTNGLLHAFAAGLKEEGIEVRQEKLHPLVPLRFPVGTIFGTLRMMLTALVRFRVPVRELPDDCRGEYDLVVLAGPTWSYNPSGPVLSFLDRDGEKLLRGRTVLPLISCRGYWRMHRAGLVRMLKRCGAEVPNCIAFNHPNKEPWRTIGVFLKIAGKAPERSRFLGRHYHRFGHSREQQEEAHVLGRRIGKALRDGMPLAGMDLRPEFAGSP